MDDGSNQGKLSGLRLEKVNATNPIYSSASEKMNATFAFVPTCFLFTFSSGIQKNGMPPEA
jgi:hypothetical protein